MNLRRLIYAALCVTMLMAGTAAARDADGRLGLIQTPNNTLPAIVAPGGSFEATLTCQAEITLAGTDGSSVAVPAQWSELPGGLVKASCTVPAGVAPGLYTLEAKTADGTDSNGRAVAVVADTLEYYLAAHLSAPAVAADGTAMAQTISAVNESGAAFCLITGDLTQDGTPEQFRAFLQTIDNCTVPTFICPGPRDRVGGVYESFIGQAAYFFSFGGDGYIGFDTADACAANGLAAQDGELYVYRRAIRSCRWSVGFTYRCDESMAMRTQLTLFADDPLDYIFCGRATDDKAASTAWGTALTITPAGYARFIEVSARGVRAREPQRITGAAAPAESAP